VVRQTKVEEYRRADDTDADVVREFAGTAGPVGRQLDAQIGDQLVVNDVPELPLVDPRSLVQGLQVHDVPLTQSWVNSDQGDLDRQGSQSPSRGDKSQLPAALGWLDRVVRDRSLDCIDGRQHRSAPFGP